MKAKIIAVLTLAAMFAALAFAQSEKQKYLDWNLDQATTAAKHAMETYQKALDSPTSDYKVWKKRTVGAHLLFKRAYYG